MGTQCHLVAILSFSFMCFKQLDALQTVPEELFITDYPTIDFFTTIDPPVLGEFYNAQTDFIGRDMSPFKMEYYNRDFFPLNDSLIKKNELLGVSGAAASTLEDMIEESQVLFLGYRNYEHFDVMGSYNATDADVAMSLPEQTDSLDASSLMAVINKYPTDLNALHRHSQLVKTSGSVADEDSFLSGLSVPQLVLPETEFIVGYRFKVSESTQDYSARSVAKLPVDDVLMISKDWFTQEELKTKMKDLRFIPRSESLLAWYTVAEKYLNDAEITDNFDAYSKFILASPIVKMLEKMKNLSAGDRIKILQDHNLEAIRVQAIWDSIEKDALIVEEINEQEVSTLFFSVGNKLDITQIDKFYKETFAHLYSKRHELEELWIQKDGVDVPWPILKYISALHWPSVATDAWGQKELLDLGAFGVALTRDQLKRIPATAFSRVSTVQNFFSDRLSLGQLFVIYDKINEGATDSYTLPVHLYPCLHSSLLKGDEPSGNMRIEGQVEDFLKASKMFTPAQRNAYFSHLKPDLWTGATDSATSTLSLVLAHNPSLLGLLDTHEFLDNLDTVLTAVWAAGRDNFDQILSALRGLPYRLLHAWLKAAVLDKDGNLSIDTMLAKSDSADYYTRLRNSDKAANIALPGLCCDLIRKIPSDRLMEVLSVYRATLPGEVVPSSARMCFVSAIRTYLQKKAAAVKLNVTSEIELLSMLTSSDIRSIGAELLLSWGGNVISNIPHPEVSYEILLKIGEEFPHLFFHNGVTPADVKVLAEQFFKMLKHRNFGNVNISVLKKLGSLVPYLESDLLSSVTSQSARELVSSVYNSHDLMKGVCLCAEQRSKLKDLILKGYGAPDSWQTDDLVQLGDLLITMQESDLYKVEPDVLRRALPTLVKRSVYSNVKLPEVRGYLAPQMYYVACQEWLKTDVEDGEESFSSAWERLARWHMSGASLLTSTLPKPAQPRTEARRKRSADSSMKFLQMDNTYKKVMEILVSRFPTLSGAARESSKKMLNLSRQQLATATSNLLDGETNIAENLSYDAKQSLRMLTFNTQVKLVCELKELLHLTVADIGSTADMCHVYTVDKDVRKGLEIAEYVFSRVKRETDDVDFMKLHDKVIALLMERFSTLSTEQQETSKVIITESQELIGNGTLLLLGLDPTTLSLSEANVLKLIEDKKNAGLTEEQESGIVKIAKDAQVRLVQKLSNLMSLTNEDLDISSDVFTQILAMETFKNTEAFVSTAVYDFTTVDTPTVAGNTGTEAGASVTTTTQSIGDIVISESEVVHELVHKVIPMISVVKVTCDMIKTAGASAGMLTKDDLYSMDSQEVRDCMEDFGKLEYAPTKARELWPALKSKLGVENSFSEGDMVLLRNLLPAVASQDPDMLDVTRLSLDAVSVLGEAVVAYDGDDMTTMMAKYLESTDTGSLTELELRSLGGVLCGMTEHNWDTQNMAVLKNAVTQVATFDCKVDNKEVATVLKRKFAGSESRTDQLGWLTPFVLEPDNVEFEELSSSATQNLLDLDVYTADNLMSLNPQAVSLIPADRINQLTDTDKLTALAKSGGEDPRLRALVTGRLVQQLGTPYPPPLHPPEEETTTEEMTTTEDPSLAVRHTGHSLLMMTLLSVLVCLNL